MFPHVVLELDMVLGSDQQVHTCRAKQNLRRLVVQNVHVLVWGLGALAHPGCVAAVQR